MDKYFDAFLYFANWGNQLFKLRLPTRLLDAKTARLYCRDEGVSMREKNGKLVLTFQSEGDNESDWIEGAGQLSSLISVRAELARGDLRGLYLGWLSRAQSGDLDDEEHEPPVPAGLGQLSASLESLVDLLRIDAALVGAAAMASPPILEAEPKPAQVRAWLAKLPIAEKDELLARVIAGNGGALAGELVQRVKSEHGRDQGAGKAVANRRTVAELRGAAERAAHEARRVAEAKAARAKTERERAAERARTKHLDQLAGQERALWEKVEGLVASKLPKAYDLAVVLLVDLRDLAARKDGADFRRRVEALRAAHARKPTLIARLDKAGL